MFLTIIHKVGIGRIDLKLLAKGVIFVLCSKFNIFLVKVKFHLYIGSLGFEKNIEGFEKNLKIFVTKTHEQQCK